MFSFIKRLIFSVLVFLSLSNLAFASIKKVGVIVPLEHEAMTQIIDGIKSSLETDNVEIIVKSGHSDANILLAIIKQMKDSDIDVIMPIGTTTSQMTISHIKNKPIVCVAASVDNRDNKLVTGINDEIPITSFLTQLPSLQDITIIYSASEKVMPEVEELTEYALKANIKVHSAMIQTLNDLPSAVKTSPKDTQAFVILKDHLVVSGINVLMQEAIKRNIPVIASDEGSVIQGATMAFGVKERDIGIKAGLIVQNILKGAAPSTIPYQTVDSCTLFISKSSFEKQNIISEQDISSLSLPRINVDKVTQ